MNQHPLPDPATPDDFPRDYGLGTVTGAQPKLLVQKVGESYVSGLTEQELYVRYDVCFDLVNQLVDYCRKKLAERPEWTQCELLEKVQRAVAARVEWDFSPGELQWMMAKLSARMDWSPLDSSRNAQ